MKIEEKVALLAIKQAPESHIVVDEAICGTCRNRISVCRCQILRVDVYIVRDRIARVHPE